MSAATVKTLGEEFSTAFGSGDYETAKLKLIEAMTRVLLLPNVRQDGAMLQWRISSGISADFSEMIDKLDELIAQSTTPSRNSINFSPVTYV